MSDERRGTRERQRGDGRGVMACEERWRGRGGGAWRGLASFAEADVGAELRT